MWKYNSPIGPMYIKKLPGGLYGFEYNGTIWEACDTPQAEADNVYMQCTGCSDWDFFNASNADVPSDLSDWDTV